MRFFKMTLPIMLAFVMAVVAIASVFIPHHYSDMFRTETVVWFRCMGGVTIFIAVYSLLRVHYPKIKRRQKGWGYSFLLYLSFAVTVLFGALNYGLVKDENRAVVKDADGQPVKRFLGPFKSKTTLAEGTRWIYDSIQWPAGSTQYALLGFFICSAAYRTFRAKTVEAAVLLVAALVVMLGQVPLSALVWKQAPVVSGWLIDVPNMAVKRAIMFGICVGAVGTSLRVMFGIERSYMGGD